MAEIVNLKRIRKAKIRAEKDEIASANRIKFGRTKAEREKAEAGTELEARKLDGHKREDD
jgi:hypothetical protein